MKQYTNRFQRSAGTDFENVPSEKKTTVSSTEVEERKYTEDDIINVAKFATGTFRTEKQIRKYIQSLQPELKSLSSIQYKEGNKQE